MAIVLDSNREMYKAAGMKFAEGYTQAFDTDRQVTGVVKDDTQEFHITLPLNGWRARNLAEVMFGERDASKWELGKSMVLEAKHLQDLPAFDQRYYDYLSQFAGELVWMQVVKIDPGYGHHIVVGRVVE